MDWQLADAKNRLSEVVTLALSEGPQRIRRRDGAVMVVSETDYRRLTGEQETLMEYILSGPDLSELDLRRDPGPMREVDW